MELISQRVARGLAVKPKRRKRKTPFGSRVNLSVEESLERRRQNNGADDSAESSVDWNKWGDRVVRTKAWAGDVKQVFKADNWKSLDSWTSAVNPLKARSDSSGSQQGIKAFCELVVTEKIVG